MQILFSDKNSINKGSVRIWIYNLYNQMKELGYDVLLNEEINTKTDVVIFGKATPYVEIIRAKKRKKNLIIGIVNPSDANILRKKILKIADFYITGSIEERDYYLKYNRNTFIYPLIETIFTKQKVHTDKNEIILSYHGNKHHLEQFYPNITKALNKIALFKKIKLLAIYDIKNTGKWRTGRPDIKIEDIQWNIKTIEKELLRSDIGLVSGLNPITNFQRKAIRRFLQIINPKQTRFINDYIIEFKNTTNAGRAFVYYQLGIPVISDFLPSAFHILTDENNGFLAHSTEAWIRAIEILSSSAEKRTYIAGNAKYLFDKYYNPKIWAEKLHDEIKQICQSRKNMKTK